MKSRLGHSFARLIRAKRAILILTGDISCVRSPPGETPDTGFSLPIRR